MRKLAVAGLIGIMCVATVGCGQLKPIQEQSYLEKYEIYKSFDEKERKVANDFVSEYLNEGMDEEHACKLAIADTMDYIYEYHVDFVTNYCVDTDENGVYDSIEKGEISEVAVDAYLNRFKPVGSEI